MTVRQLWHLAVADLASSLSVSVYLSVPLLLSGGYLPTSASRSKDVCCVASSFLALSSFFASSAVEVHLSMSLLAGLCRSVRVLKVLFHGLPCVWPIGLLLGTMHLYVVGVFRVSEDEWCSPTRDTVFVVSEILCLLVCAFCYFACFLRVRVAQDVGLSVQRKVWARARLYLVAWFFCTCPLVVATMWFPSATALTFVSMSISNLNGVANFIVYVCLSKFSQRLGMRSRMRPITSQDGQPFSFHVTLGGTSSRGESELHSCTSGNGTFEESEGIADDLG